MREFINLVEGRQQLDEVSKKQKQNIDSMVDSIDTGSTYADVEKIYNSLPGGFFKGDRNYFLGNVAKKLNVKGMYKPDSSKMGGIVLTTPSENSTRFEETGTAFGLGMNKDDVKKLANLNMLPPNRLEKAKEKYPDWDVWKSDADSGETNLGPKTDTKSVVNKALGKTADGKLQLSGGETFYRTPDGKGLRLLQKHAGGLVRRMDELVRKMNESVPNSLKSVISESDKSQLMFEALTDKESVELIKLVNDLQLIVNFTDDQGYLISDQNRSLVSSRIKEYQPVIDKAKSQLGATPTDQDADQDADIDKDAEKASDASDDKGADKDADEKPVAGSLAKFAKSGKGGLANDPDEVEAIKELQQYLTDMGFDPNGVDGKYGGGTVKGVKAFQKYFGANEDGDAGPETIEKIIKLRSFRFKDGKNFADFRKDMSRMEELIKKGGANPIENSSNDFRSLISIVEQSLTEALSDQEQKELDDLLAQYSDVMNDAEFAAAMPKVSYDRYKKIVDDAKKLSSGDTTSAGTYNVGDKITKEIQDKLEELGLNKGMIGEPLTQADVDALNSADTDTDTGQPSDKLDGKDGDLSSSSEPVAKYADLNAALNDRDNLKKGDVVIIGDEKCTVDETGQGEKFFLDSKGEPYQNPAANGATELASVIEVWNEIKAMRDKQPKPSPERTRLNRLMNSIKKSTTTPEEAAEILRKAKEEGQSTDKGAGNAPEFGKEYGDTHNPDGSLKPGAAAWLTRDKTAGNAAGNVEPRPTGGGHSGRNARKRWDKEYGSTHNADGTPKTDGAAAGNSETPNTAKKVSKGAQARLDGYMSTPGVKTDQKIAIGVAKKILADTEAFALLDPKTQATFKSIAKMN